MYIGYNIEKIKAMPGSNHALLTEAKPFPGKYPTRVALETTFKDGRPNEVYIGKPNEQLVKRLKGIHRTIGYVGFAYYEFDMGQLVLLGRTLGVDQPVKAGVYVWNIQAHWANSLAKLYRPTFTHTALSELPYAVQKWRTETALGVVRVYVPAASKPTREIREGWRHWVVSMMPQDKLKQKPPFDPASLNKYFQGLR